MSVELSLSLTLATFGLSAWLTSRFCRPESRLYFLDHPNERSLHTQPTPRTGGIAIVAAVLLAGLITLQFISEAYTRLGWLAAAMLTVAGVSFADDRMRLAAGVRFAVHVIAAGVLAAGGFVLVEPALPDIALTMPDVVAVAVTVLYIVWMLNLYNFMDGMDGFAGGMTVFGFGTFAVLGWTAGAELFAVLNLIVAAAAGGFLIFNFPPARIFMGDVGSSTLGLLVAAFSLWGAELRVFPFWVAVLVFSPFIVDATVTLIRRLLQGQKVWEAHKTHYYQRLVQAGWGHRKTVLVEYLIMFGCGITALLSLHATVTIQAIMLAGWVLFYIIFFSWVSWYVSRQRHGSA